MCMHMYMHMHMCMCMCKRCGYTCKFLKQIKKCVSSCFAGMQNNNRRPCRRGLVELLYFP